ncbi:hypothetical protein [Devosia sp. Naph2]|uniref:hypothetical protein n=1 Tax=Devosia polycyclovorans TaxID=3345148 RepID=UPI0035CF8379
MQHAFEKRRSPGRPKGAPNKTTVQVKAALEKAYDGIGGLEAFTAWARENQTEFYKLYAKLLPLEVRADIKHEGAVTIIVDTGIPRTPDGPLVEARPC